MKDQPAQTIYFLTVEYATAGSEYTGETTRSHDMIAKQRQRMLI
jgi:hypothetical protein